jgi:hypothetical protein
MLVVINNDGALQMALCDVAVLGQLYTLFVPSTRLRQVMCCSSECVARISVQPCIINCLDSNRRTSEATAENQVLTCTSLEIRTGNLRNKFIIIIIIVIIVFMQGIYNYITETNHVSRENSVVAIL